jgi:uncharacterized cupredoxin-like copper-binding protein
VKTIPKAATLVCLFCNSSLAAGSHSTGHSHEMEIGQPGNKHINRSVTVKMSETENGMIFKPDQLSFKAGQTIKIKLINKGEFEHEFVMDTMAAIVKHKAMMEDSPDMNHSDPNSLRLGPNEKGEILWTFSNAGTFEFACLIPGHYEAGMHGEISIK